MISQGSLDWTDYRAEADATPWMAAGAGIAARVQGLRRYYALLLTSEGRARVVRANDDVTVLSDVAFDVEYFRTYELALEVNGLGSGPGSMA